MKLRGILALALMLVCAPALAQVNPGTSPLTGPKGGTNNAFMQFTGPATSLKTFTLPNVSGTVAVLNQIQVWTALQTFPSPVLTTPVINGASTGTGVASVATPSTIAIRDASGNLFANNFTSGGTNVASAGGTTTLTVASTFFQRLTGTLAQTFKLPDATTLTVGAYYEFDNNSTGLLSIVDNGSNAITTVPAGGYARVSIVNVGSANGTWDPHFFIPANVQWGTSSLSMPSTTVSSAAQTIISPAAIAFSVGLTSANPAFAVNDSAGSQAAGLNIVGAVAGGTVGFNVIDSSANANLVINAKGTGTIGIGNVSTGAVTITPPLTLGTPLAITNGGTGQTTVNAARQSSGLNVYGDAGTAHGDAGVTLGNTERFAYTNAAFTASRAWVLPAANVTGQPYTLKVADLAGGVTATNTLVITRAGADTINGGSTATISAANGGYECSSDGSSKWSCLSMGAASAGGVSSVACGTGLTGGTITTSGTCALALNSHTIQAGPFNPSGATSTTLVMMGTGSTCTITPLYSSRIFVQYTGVIFNATAGQSTRVQSYFGTGTAPANAAAVTGTSIGSLLSVTSTAVNASYSYTAGGIVTGLTPGTAYWLDVALDVTGGTGTTNQVFCSAFEIL
jgi:hypothetical protein